MADFSWISAAPTEAGATPLWHPGERRLYWGDAATGRLCRLNPADGAVETLLGSGRPIGAMTLQGDGSLLLFRDGGAVDVFRDGRIDGSATAAAHEFRLTRFSAAAAAPDGRVVCAMLADLHHPGRLFLLGRDGRLSPIADGFASPGGLAFAADGKSFLLSDSHPTRRVILRFAYDASAKNPCTELPAIFRECIEDARDWPGRPVGLALAADGSLWTARCDAATAIRHDADGVPVEQLRLKVRRPVGLCFGGDALADLYITSSGAHRRAFEGLHAGDVICARGLPVGGARPFRSLVGLPDPPPEEKEEPAVATPEEVAPPAATPVDESAPSPDESVPPVESTPPAAPPEATAPESSGESRPPEPANGGFVSL